MSDLLSEQHGILQMSDGELLDHVKAARLRRRERNQPAKPKRATKKKVSAKKDPKKAMAKLEVEDLKKLLERALERSS